MLLILLPTVWLGLATLVVCLCRMAAMSDGRKALGRGARGPFKAQLLVLELPVPSDVRRRAWARAGTVSAHSSLRPRGLATIHPIR